MLFARKEMIEVLLPALPTGCSDSPAKTLPSLLYADSRRGSHPQGHHAPLQAQRLVVLPPVDGLHILDLTPHPGRPPSRPVAVPVWKDPSLASLALCRKHGVSASPLFHGHVFNGDKTGDVFKTRNPY